MKYALLIYEARGSFEALPKEQYEAMFAEYMALSNKSRFLNGARLQPAGTATRSSPLPLSWRMRTPSRRKSSRKASEGD